MDSSADEREAALRRLNFQYNLGKPLGSGASSMVYEARSLCGQKFMAIKLPTHAKYISHFWKEIEILKKIHAAGQCESIVKMIRNGILGDEEPFIVFQQYGPSLFDCIRRSKRALPLDRIARTSLQLAEALDYLHRKVQILHGDVKPENVLVKDPRCLEDKNMYFEVVLIDVGSAIRLDDEAALNNENRGLIGTKPYQSLEQSLQIEFNEKIDIWAYGCTIFELYRGYPLFQHNGLSEHLMLLQWLFGQIPHVMLLKYYERYVETNKKAKRKKIVDFVKLLHDLIPRGTEKELNSIHYDSRLMLSNHLGLAKSNAENGLHKLIIDTLQILPEARPTAQELIENFFTVNYSHNVYIS